MSRKPAICIYLKLVYKRRNLEISWRPKKKSKKITGKKFRARPRRRKELWQAQLPGGGVPGISDSIPYSKGSLLWEANSLQGVNCVAHELGLSVWLAMNDETR